MVKLAGTGLETRRKSGVAMHAKEFEFRLHHRAADCRARRTSLRPPHGTVQLPAFMPVATQGAVKGLTVDQLRSTGAEIVLGNAYHLALRPGSEEVASLGGLHQMMGWDGPILTDSGGFQLFSLARLTRVEEEGAHFQSHIDGSRILLTPERSIEIQQQLGSDIAMVLDHVLALPAPESAVQDACERTIRWAERCRTRATSDRQLQFAIVQGGLDADLRVDCARQLVELDFPGYAIGGLSVGESAEEMDRIVEVTAPHLPEDRPRYLMGVGRPEDLLSAISSGIDMFDCVMPTRNGRNGMAFTNQGPLRIRNQIHRGSSDPLEDDCPCAACGHGRGYLRHLFQAGEMLGPILLSLHNLTFYQRLMSEVRSAIEADCLSDLVAEKRARWGSRDGRERSIEPPT